MRVGVISDRRIDDQHVFTDTLSAVLEDNDVNNAVFVIGGAPGPDAWTREYAKKMEEDYVIFLPYHKLDKSAEFTPKFFFVRNRQIISNSDVVVVVQKEDVDRPADINHAIEYAEKKGKALLTAAV